MYNVLDQDTSLSYFPTRKGKMEYGLTRTEQKLDASHFYNLRDKPATALMLHGKDDWLCHYSQSEKYAEKIRNAGGNSKVVLYEAINHTCLNINYPEVFSRSVMEIAKLYANEFQLRNVDFKAIERDIDKATKLFYPYDIIPDQKLIGVWKSNKGTFVLQENGKGHFINTKGAQTEEISYQNNGSLFSVSIKGEKRNRTFYLRKNGNSIYELRLENNRWKSRRDDYRKLVNW